MVLTPQSSPPTPQPPPPPPPPPQHRQQQPKTSPPKPQQQPTTQNQDQNMVSVTPPLAGISQPLHNFTLPDIKWAMNHHSNAQRLRKLTITEPSRKSPQAESDSDSNTLKQELSSNLVTESVKNVSPGTSSGFKTEKSGMKGKERVAAAAEGTPVTKKSSTDDMTMKKKSSTEDKLLKKKSSKEVPQAADGGGKSKICIRIRTKNNTPTVKKDSDEVAVDAGANRTEAEAEAEADPGMVEVEEDFVAKTWNLRPRKPINGKKKKAANGSNGGAAAGGANGGGTSQGSNKGGAKPDSKNNGNTKTASDKKKKKAEGNWPKFSLTLTKEEIEEDLFIMTGARPSRRPKKRAKNVQKQIDMVTPGTWLGTINADTYRVDPPLKV